jgi:argininosuccinate lyase
MKLWSKDNTDTSKQVEKFTVGKDKEFDLLLAPFDVLGSMAHAKMLASVGLLTNDEANEIVAELKIFTSSLTTHNSPLTIQ